MSPPPAPSSFTAEDHRALELDALAAVLPVDRRDFLATMLTDEDVATLKHLVSEGMGENTLRALSSDLAYLEAWSNAATGYPLPWPAPEGLALKFVAHHLWDADRRANDPTHGMPAEVMAQLKDTGFLRTEGPHAPATVRRRLAHWATLHRWKGLPCVIGSDAVRTAVRLAVRAGNRPRTRKSARSVTTEVLDQLLATCGGFRLVDARDAALLLVAFGSGGRRRSEMAKLRVEHIVEEPPVPLDPSDAASPLLPCIRIRLGRTKTTVADDGSNVILVGRPVEALKSWLERAKIREGFAFRAIDRWGRVSRKGVSPQSINLIVKTRCARANLDPALFSAHGLRAGFLTEAARQGVPLPEAMAQSQHRSVQQAASYYNDAERKNGKAVRIFAMQGNVANRW